MTGHTFASCNPLLHVYKRHQDTSLLFCSVKADGVWHDTEDADAESQVHGKIDRFGQCYLIVWATLDDLTWGQVDQDGLDAASDDALECVVRIMHTQGVGQYTEGGLGTGWNMGAVGYVRQGWTGQSDGQKTVKIGDDDVGA